jgi:hypothetical protein
MVKLKLPTFYPAAAERCLIWFVKREQLGSSSFVLPLYLHAPTWTSDIDVYQYQPKELSSASDTLRHEKIFATQAKK